MMSSGEGVAGWARHAAGCGACLDVGSGAGQVGCTAARQCVRGVLRLKTQGDKSGESGESSAE